MVDPAPIAEKSAGQDSLPVAELTPRALLAGGAIGALLACGNVYLGLKTGLWDGGSVAAAILGFATFALLELAWRSRACSPLENNIVQTTAAAMGAMPATIGLLGAFPGLALLGHRYATWSLMGWGAALGILGVLVAAALRHRLIEQENLPFPTGVATGELILAMHAKRAGGVATGLARARCLGASALLSLLVSWLRSGRLRWIPEAASFPGRIGGISLASLGLGVSFSPMLLGVGVLCGLQVGTSLLLGALIGWGALAPTLVRSGVVASADYDALASWLIWPGLGVMIGASVTALLDQSRLFFRAAVDLVSVGATHAASDRRAARFALAGAAATTVALVALAWRIFGLHPLATLVLVALSLLLGALCARAAGQTDVAPLSQVGQLTQGLYAMVLPGGAAANIAAGAVPSGAAAQTAQTLWGLRAGRLVGASPRRQIWAQLWGVALGAVLCVPVYQRLLSRQALGTAALPAPAGRIWSQLGKALAGSTSALPPHALLAGGLGLLAGILLELPAFRRAVRLAPVAVAIGLGFILPAATCVTICAGSLLLALSRRLWPAKTEHYGTVAGAGAIAGESLIGIVIALFA